MNDFNKDMDRYLKTRREPKKNSGFSVKINKKPKFNEGINPYAGKGMKKKQDNLEELEDELEEIESEKNLSPDEVEEKKEGVLKRIFGMFKSEREEENIEEDVVDMPPIFDEQIKEALKIGIKWIEKLPKPRLREFQESGDAEKYKEALIKCGIARRK